MKSIPLRIVMILAAAVSFGTGGIAYAQETVPQAPPLGSSLELSKFYTGPLGHRGVFSGKLLCLCCDLAPKTDKPKTCDANGHHHVLLIEDETMLHPLLAGTEDVAKVINSNELHGKKVLVRGNYYPTTGYILVQKIEAE